MKCERASERPAWYLCRHGQRREWELLTELATRELHKGLRGGIARVWPGIKNSGEAETNPWAVPALGAMLATPAGMSSAEVDEVIGYLHKQTHIEFGGDEKRAREWWETSGKSEYTFDKIAERLAK